MDKCIEKSFTRHTILNAKELIKENYNSHLNSKEFINSLKSIENNSTKPILIFNNEIIKFSQCVRGNNFSNEVKQLLNSKT